MAKANIRQLEAFNAVMKAGSVTKAAEALFVSQPAVSKLLHAFELSCGFALFNRTKGRLIPTPEARQLFAETSKLEQGLMRVHEAARAIRELERGEISIVAFPAISMRLIPRRIGALLRERPEVRLSLFTRTSRSVEHSMITRAADIGISLVPSNNPALRCEPFATVSMICALRRDHPLAGEKVISLESLENERLVALGREDLSYPAISAAFQRAGLAMNPAAEVQMADAACAMVAEGYGVAIVASLSAFDPVHPEVVFRPIRQRVTMTVWVMTSAYQELSQVAIALMEEIRATVEELEAGLRGQREADEAAAPRRSAGALSR
ncbi:LysR substrate-binding domain-containing protein [Afifella sp. IM 167]|uniref:LysR substrate-binding domain-containing protein n=1 Tax=Afifella sp. IM 167 TaxID=2033586 RepID=UPI001CCB508A|nr:LysR substrate-binding domain-containing protein [Afifella sp. IM 167]MBZ8134499.1 LysR family transcriptional regulator [Afifella sp. IM 167]